MDIGSSREAEASAATVEQFRQALAARHTAEGTVDEEAVANALLTFSLMRLHTRLSQDFESIHRRRGWSWPGFRIMNVLWALSTVEVRDLARLTGDSRAAISSAVKTLERDGLVLRSRSDHDRRLVDVTLTELGISQLKEGMLDQARREKAWFAALTPSARSQLTATLTSLADQARPQA
ncbi:MarR family winged helix-turn-helix transcriptional regulator [Streptomyces sp. NPDC001156]